MLPSLDLWRNLDQSVLVTRVFFLQKGTRCKVAFLVNLVHSVLRVSVIGPGVVLNFMICIAVIYLHMCEWGTLAMVLFCHLNIIDIQHTTTGQKIDSNVWSNRHFWLLPVITIYWQLFLYYLFTRTCIYNWVLYNVSYSWSDRLTTTVNTGCFQRAMPASNARRWPEGDVGGDECELKTLAIVDPSERWLKFSWNLIMPWKSFLCTIAYLLYIASLGIYNIVHLSYIQTIIIVSSSAMNE